MDIYPGSKSKNQINLVEKPLGKQLLVRLKYVMRKILEWLNGK
jgi:hypothetical protein